MRAAEKRAAPTALTHAWKAHSFVLTRWRWLEPAWRSSLLRHGAAQHSAPRLICHAPPPLLRNRCLTCSLSYKDCPGHLGSLELPLPVFNPLLFNELYRQLRVKCYMCHHVKLRQQVRRRPCAICGPADARACAMRRCAALRH